MALIKRIKNISGITKQILNRDIAHNAYYEIPETLWQELANDQNIKTDISNGNLIVNDGVSDLTINDALRYVVQFQEVDADEVNFIPPEGMIANNVQNALEEIRNSLITRPGTPITCGFDGTAFSGRWLEFSGNVAGNISGFIVPSKGNITHLSVAVQSNTTCTFTLYKNNSSVGTLSLSSARKNSNTQNITIAQNDELAVKVTSGSGSRPIFNIFIRLD